MRNVEIQVSLFSAVFFLIFKNKNEESEGNLKNSVSTLVHTKETSQKNW